MKKPRYGCDSANIQLTGTCKECGGVCKKMSKYCIPCRIQVDKNVYKNKTQNKRKLLSKSI